MGVNYSKTGMKMFRRISVGCLVVASCMLTGCLEQSVVIKVKPNGAGVVHVRKHVQKSSFAKSDGDKKLVPSEENVSEMVAALGGNARLVSLKKSLNHNGWSGYDLIVAFDDINNIVLPDNLESLLSGDPPSSNGQQLKMAFSYKEGLLDIKTTGFADDAKQANQEKTEGAVNPFASEPSSPLAVASIPDAAMLEILAKVAVDAKAGVFVQLDGDVKESNAKHQKGNLITLMKVNIGEVLDHPDSLAKLKQLEGNDLKRAAATKIANSIEGFVADFQPSIKVRFE